MILLKNYICGCNLDKTIDLGNDSASKSNLQVALRDIRKDVQWSKNGLKLSLITLVDT